MGIEPTVDYLIFTVLPETEFRAVLTAFGCNPNAATDTTLDDLPLYLTSIAMKDGHALKVYITCLGGKGNVVAAGDVGDILRELQPKCAFLVGTSAGASSVNVGDVIVSTEGIWYYEQNYQLNQLHHRPAQERPSRRQVRGFQQFYTSRAAAHGWYSHIEATVEDLVDLGDRIVRIPRKPRVHLKSIASGEKIVYDEDFASLESISDQIVAADQESWAFATECSKRSVEWMIIRGASDHGDKTERKRFAMIASINAACYIWAFVHQLHLPLLKELPSTYFHSRTTIGGLVKQHLAANSELDLGYVGGLGESSVKDLIGRLAVAYPDVPFSRIERAVHDAREFAFNTKYKSPPPYEDERLVMDVWEIEIDSLLEHLGPFAENEKVIEMGCANGAASRHLIERFDGYVGVDISSDALNAAHEQFPHRKFVRGLSEDLPGFDRRFGLYLSFRTYQSGLFSLTESLLQAFRVLRPGGVVVISIPYKYATEEGVAEGLKMPGRDFVDRELPYSFVQRIRQTMFRYSFTDVGIHTGAVELYIYGRRPYPTEHG